MQKKPNIKSRFYQKHDVNQEVEHRCSNFRQSATIFPETWASHGDVLANLQDFFLQVHCVSNNAIETFFCASNCIQWMVRTFFWVPQPRLSERYPILWSVWTILHQKCTIWKAQSNWRLIEVRNGICYVCSIFFHTNSGSSRDPNQVCKLPELHSVQSHCWSVTPEFYPWDE